MSTMNNLLDWEHMVAYNLRSKANRLIVQRAIELTKNKLNALTKIPPNGLGIFVGDVVNEDGEIRKIEYEIEPIKKISFSYYECDRKFHVKEFLEFFESDERYGFVVVDGYGAIFALLQGKALTVLQNISEELPNKHARGGQSSNRFARIRIEKREAYIKKINEIITKLFINNSVKNIDGLVLAGNTYLKNEVKKGIDSRIPCLKVVDTNYGGRNGLNQAIKLSEELLKGVKYSKEKKVLQDFLHEINLNSGKYCYGYSGTIHVLDSGAVEQLIVYENLEMLHEREDFVDWIAENYKEYGCKLIFVSNQSGEGTQFLEGFGGLGGILRYPMNMATFDESDELSELSSFSDEEEMF